MKVHVEDLVIVLRRLADTLDRPHPGLVTWHQSADQKMNTVAIMIDRAMREGVTGLEEKPE